MNAHEHYLVDVSGTRVHFMRKRRARSRPADPQPRVALDFLALVEGHRPARRPGRASRRRCSPRLSAGSNGTGSCAAPSTPKFRSASNTRSPRQAGRCASRCARWRNGRSRTSAMCQRRRKPTIARIDLLLTPRIATSNAALGRYLPYAEYNALRKRGLYPGSQSPGSREVWYSGLASHPGRIASMLLS
jgi:hypothetical protein